MGSSTHENAEAMSFAEELANVPADQSGYATIISHRDLVENLQQQNRQHFNWPENPQNCQSCKCGPHAPRHGIAGLPRPFVGKDVCPSVLAKHEEHQDEDQSQEVNADSTNAFVVVVSLKNAKEVERHGNTSGSLSANASLRERLDSRFNWRND